MAETNYTENPPTTQSAISVPSAEDELAAYLIEQERRLVGAMYLVDLEQIREAADFTGFDPIAIRDEVLRKYADLVLTDDTDPLTAAVNLDLLLTLSDYSGLAVSGLHLADYMTNVMTAYRRVQQLRTAQELAKAIVDNDPLTRREKTDELAALEVDDAPSFSILTTAPADHDGHAQALLALYPDKFLFVDRWGWLYYTGRHWEREQAEEKLSAAIIDTLRERRIRAAAIEKLDLVRASRGNSNNIFGVKEVLKARVSAPTGAFDNDPDLLNCANGVLDLRTRELTAHTPAQHFTYSLPIDYDRNADQSEWLKFLAAALQIPGHDTQEMIDFIQQAIGYSLTGHTWQECMFYLYGPPRSGKGTFTETILAMLGTPLARETDMATFTSRRDGDTQNFDLAPLRPSRFVAASETSHTTPLNAEKIKSITGRNQIRCAFKHRDLFEYQPAFKIWLSSNHTVNLDVDDPAAWSRVKVIEFPNSHLGSEDIGLKRRLLSPASLRGVLAFAVEGAQIWYRESSTGQGLHFPEAIRKATQRQRDERDYVKQYTQATLEHQAGSHVLFSAVYASYKTWCEDNGVPAKYATSFGKALKNHGYIVDQKKVGGKNDRYVLDTGLI